MPVAKWSCQKSVSFSWTGSLRHQQVAHQVVVLLALVVARRLEGLDLVAEQLVRCGAARQPDHACLLQLLARRGKARAPHQVSRVPLRQDCILVSHHTPPRTATPGAPARRGCRFKNRCLVPSRSAGAPATIHRRMISIRFAASGGRPSGMREPSPTTGRSPVILWYRKLISGSFGVMRFQPEPLRGDVVRHDADDLRVGRADLEQHPARLALRVVAAAQRAVVVEDLLLDAIEGAVEQGRGIAAVLRGATGEPHRVAVGVEAIVLEGRRRRELAAAWSPAGSGCRGTGPSGARRCCSRWCRSPASLVGGSIWLSMRDCSAWKSGSNLGSPLSSECARKIDCTPASEHSGSAVLFAHTAIGNLHSPLTSPSASHAGSPSTQRICRTPLFSTTGVSKTARQSCDRAPPPPTMVARAAPARISSAVNASAPTRSARTLF